jgi:hypothetical protein
MSHSKQHWENVFQTKTPEQVSWTETYPQTSVDLILSFQLKKNEAIIEVGGGDSLLVDALLELGYSDITVLDISKNALDRAKKRLGVLADKVCWIECDILDFKPQKKYSLWHDRASFHFLTEAAHVKKYSELVSLSQTTHLVVGTFSPSGPTKCSGLPITQYDCEKLNRCFYTHFEQLDCTEIQHLTPFDTNQSFIFSKFKRKELS